MGNFTLDFDRPWYLLLALVIPLVWMFSYHSLAGLGRIRRLVALTLRTAVLLLFIAALAEIQLMRTGDRITVIYLLDQSESIPRAKRDVMLKFVADEVRQNRRADRGDRAGVIVFGRDATIEVQPYDDDIPFVGGVESYLERTDATNLEAAMKLAVAQFLGDSAKRIVIVTDGNENLGDALALAPTLQEQGIGIDVVPVRLTTRAEVAVEKIALPSTIRLGQPIEARVVLNNFMESADDERPVRGKVRITRRAGRRDELIGEQDVELGPGKQVLAFQHEMDKPALYTYQAVFEAERPEDDLMSQNNRATAFTHVRGQGRVLLIEDADNPGEFDYLVERLRANKIEMEVMPSNQLFSSLPELQAFDCVILGNVPRSSGEDAKTVTSFSDAQIQMLVQNTHKTGCGLIMIGGPNSFGAGGWTNTELEKAMPVDFQIKNAKIQAVGALVLMMHASEMAQGNHWQKVVAREAIKSLGPMDYCGLLHWDNFGGDGWLWGGRQGLIRVQGQRNMMQAQLSRMSPGDMPDFEPSMRLALTGFNSVNASVKHMIVISDGDPSPPQGPTVQRFRDAGIKISTVAVGTHGPPGSTPLQKLAQDTGGRYYVVSNPKALPRIYQREARRVARPLVKDLDNVAPQVVLQHRMLDGIDVATLPPLRGMVLTTVKEHPLVEVAVRSPIPADEQNSSILAAWTYGYGRAVAFTTDAGHRWASAWTEWENYDKFFTQMVRWAMRPPSDSENYTVATDYKDGKVRVVITALDENDRFLSLPSIGASAISPDLNSIDIAIQQQAAGRYVGEFEATGSGSYHISISPGPGEAPLLTGINVPYSAEFRKQQTNTPLLETLASLQPKGGEAGILIGDDLDPADYKTLIEANTFRETLPKSISIQDVWPWVLLVGACLFFADVFVRRVTISFGWLAKLLAWARAKLGGVAEQGADERLERLRDRKAAVAGQIDERRAAARFEPTVDERFTDTEKELDEVVGELGDASRRPPAPRPGSSLEPLDDDAVSYTERLLKAKKKAWKEKEQDD